MVTFMVSGTPREVQLYVDDAAAASMDGPLVFYWYGTGGQPSQAESGLAAGIQTIKAAGGVVVSPRHINDGVFPWIQGNGIDYLLADEVIGCAQEKIGIDPRRVHSLGFSAGALFTSQLSFARSSYIASVATYSGGGSAAPEDASNKFPAMIFFGGPNDMVVVNFQEQSQIYLDALRGNGQFAFLCNHGRGHSIPADAAPNVVKFFLDHPFGTNPSPYASGLPAGFPAYCTL
jgi:poly(3-hydroxybutyrate) depolymerase